MHIHSSMFRAGGQVSIQDFTSKQEIQFYLNKCLSVFYSPSLPCPQPQSHIIITLLDGVGLLMVHSASNVLYDIQTSLGQQGSIHVCTEDRLSNWSTRCKELDASDLHKHVPKKLYILGNYTDKINFNLTV